MTYEEYDEIVSWKNSEDRRKRIQANIILSIFPTKETRYSYKTNEEVEQTISDIEIKLRSIIKENIYE